MSGQNMNIRRGDILFADLSPVVGSEQGGTRPVLVIQNNIGNACSPTVIVASITKSKTKATIPTHFYIDNANGLLAEKSMVLFEQLRTIDKGRIKRHVGPLVLDEKQKVEMEKCLLIGITDFCYGEETIQENVEDKNKPILIGKLIEDDDCF